MKIVPIQASQLICCGCDRQVRHAYNIIGTRKYYPYMTLCSECVADLARAAAAISDDTNGSARGAIGGVGAPGQKSYTPR